MPSAAEASGARSPLASDLKAGVESISSNQSITFTKFVKVVLPLDGYVFWVRGDLVSPPQPAVQTVPGSLHYSINVRQEEGETYGINRVVFTSEAPINFLNAVAPDTMYIGAFDGLEFAFSDKKSFYKQAELWHYVGDAVYADMKSQLITSAGQLNMDDLIVSNSLPVWLGFNTFSPNWPFYPSPEDFTLPTLYPSFLPLPNISPPWITVHIGENDTSSLASAPAFSTTQAQSQLSSDKVRLTLWGCDNQAAQNILAMINQFSVDTGLIGVRNAPAIRDAKREQRELGTLAQKKIIEYEVSYIQGQVADFARQLILTAVPNFLPQAL